MKSRVLLLSQEVHPIPPTKGAAVEQWIDAVSQRLTDFEPHIVSVPHPARPDKEVDGGVTYHRIRVGRVYNRLFRKITRIDPYPYIRRAADYAKAISAQIVHLHNAPHFVRPFREICPAALIVLHMHNEKAFEGTPSVASLVGCSRYVTEWYRERGLAAARFAVLPNGVDIDRFSPSGAGAELRRMYEMPEGVFSVLYVGRISPEKGVDRLIDAVRTLRRDDVHLVLVGEWPTGDSLKSERVRYATAVRRSLEGVRHTVIDVVPPTDVHRYFHLGDLLVIPSRFEEPFSMVAIEAMASGIPVLAARKGGMVEYLKDKENSLLFDADADPAAIADAILKAKADRALLSGISRSGRQLVTERFGWQRVADLTSELYRQVLADDHG